MGTKASLMRIKALLMRKMLFFILFITILYPYSVKPVRAGCYPLNPNTGVCDVAFTCPRGDCCDIYSECTSSTPGTFPSVMPPSLPGTAQSPLGGDCLSDEMLDTAIGCIPISDTDALVKFILTWAVGIGGGIAFALILYGGFLIMTSQGDPKRLSAGQETMTSAIMGIMLLIFSVFILRLIGVDILGIPGWT